MKADSPLDILAAWPIGSVTSVTTPQLGAMNETFLVQTEAGRFVLRGYRPRTRQWVEAEHAVLAFVTDNGMPAPAPIHLVNGGTILERDSRFYALFPMLRGSQRRRGALDPEEITAAGTGLGRLHLLLHSYTDTRLWQRPYVVQPAETLTRIAALENLIRSRPSLLASDHDALRGLAAQRDRIAHVLPTEAPDVGLLERQTLHGDYQEANLLFDGGRLTAILDWESTHVGPRLFELLRAMDLMLDLDPPACRLFLAAYDAVWPLDRGDLELAAAQWGWFRAHNLWLYETLYREENERVRRYLRPGGFVPFELRWQAVRKELP